jgi:hypothetical protein
LHRRRFLKYAGGATIAIGASALGLDYLLKPQLHTPNQVESSLTTSSNSTSMPAASSTQLFSVSGRLFFDKGTSQYGTAGNGIQDDADSEPGQMGVRVMFLDDRSNVAAAATTDSSGDFKADLPKGNFLMYPVTDEFTYMSQGVNEFRRVSDGYPITIGENNPKISIGLMQGFLSFPKKGINLGYGGYYDRDPRKGYTLAWDGVTGEGTGQAGECWDNDSGTHFLAEYGDIISSFAPGIVTDASPDLPDNWVWISTDTYPPFVIGLAHSSEILVTVGQRVSRYQPVAKAGNRGHTYPKVVVHLTLGQWVANNFRIYDPYKPVYQINPDYYGCWMGGKSDVYADWLSLPTSQNANLQNYWIVQDQTHF